MEDNKPNKRLTSDKNYKRPEKTYQDTLTNQEIKEKLKEYKKCKDIRQVSIGTQGRFVVLGNGKFSWSVQIGGTQFWQKMSEAEFKEELKKEIKKEMATEDFSSVDPMIEKENKDLKKEIISLMKKIENLEDANKSLVKKNEQLGSQLTKIATEIKKEKKGK